MEWFAFLIKLLFAVCTAFVVWTVIKIGIHETDSEGSVSPEPPELEAKGTKAFDKRRHFYWNFTATLIVVPAILLLLGITMKTAPLNHPVTGTLAGALFLLWGMALWSGMLTLPEQIIEVNETETPLVSDIKTGEVPIPKTTIDVQEKPR